ncbi:ABC transporter ATP-binding protein [Oceanibium sediminis]|uniref:ABC transporter ATP-binding protein n=1 Tax=Oceanibium sediminis TaxID=2026339 RepID=UPI001E2BF282|nr:ABC transporter ATP-binding protein [Oceanibium sediminis]
MVPPKSLLKRLWQDELRQHLPVLLLALFLMTIEGTMLGALSYMVQPMFDRVFVGGDSGAVWLISGIIFAVFTARAIAGFSQRYLVVLTGLRVTTSIQRRLTAHLLSLDTGFFQMNAPGALIERVRGDAQALQASSSAALMTMGRDSVSLVALLSVAVWIDWLWALLVFAGVPLIALPLVWLQSRIRGNTRRAREHSATLSTRLDEIFHGIPAIKVNTLEANEQARFAASVDDYLSAERSSQIGLAALPALIDIMAAIGFLGVLTIGGQQIIAGEKSVGEFMSFFTAMALIFDPLRRLSNVTGQIQAALASLERLYQLFDSRPQVVPPANPRFTAVPSGDITFENVSFAYGDKTVLKNLSFTAKQGQTTAFVGASGAGKTTVFNLLPRLLDPTEGQILIGGQPLRETDLHALRAHFAQVSQDAALFDESIAQNIRLGRLDATPEQIEAAAERATVLDFARDLPLGLDSPAGPRGSNLSGGQRQRVAIARAMLRDAPVLLLDEPTSALDARSEAVIQTALDRLATGRTTLVIAHRLATIRNADKIIVMDQGGLVDEGTHEELIARGGLYAQLHALQFSDDKTA